MITLSSRRRVEIRGEKSKLLCKLNEVVLLDSLAAEERKFHAKVHTCTSILWLKFRFRVNNSSILKYSNMQKNVESK
jgi:hypothetical protein